MTNLSNSLQSKDFTMLIGSGLTNPATSEDIVLYKWIADRAASKVTMKCGIQSGKILRDGHCLFWIYSWALPYHRDDMPLLFVTAQEQEYLDIRKMYSDEGRSAQRKGAKQT